jgi:hypothetical protein
MGRNSCIWNTEANLRLEIENIKLRQQQNPKYSYVDFAKDMNRNPTTFYLALKKYNIYDQIKLKRIE